MLASSTGGTMFTTGRTVPRVAVAFTGFALMHTRGFNPVEVARDTTGVAGSQAVTRHVGFGSVTAKNAASGFGVI